MPEEELKYHEQVPCWPEFKIQGDAIDGWIPSCRLNDLEHFMKWIREADHKGLVYRGQRRYDWNLFSSLSRRYKDKLVPRHDRAELFEQFRLAMRSRGPQFKLPDKNEIWAYGQHNGLHTPLLDWSKSPFISLYFAFVESDDSREKKPNTSRAMFCLNRSLLAKEGLLRHNIFYEPASDEHIRLVSQAGLFTISPSGRDDLALYIIKELESHKDVDLGVPDDNEAFLLSKYLHKIHIPNIGREEYLDVLKKMNIHHGSLFPDAFGAAQFANEWLRQRII
ncbi:MAG: FRG domain-containing protein [Gammaproteobacteria bacterium AqS3]|nr:FRG domain-containing protein [Gammaproteobacteria bacterium AqS3]